MRYVSLFLCSFFLCACDSIAHHLVDADGDGHSAASDCNDGNPAIHPSAPEICGDMVDSDCDGFVNGGAVAEGITLFPDQDDDGHGTAEGQRIFCALEAGWSPLGDDCDDTSEIRSPSAVEICGDGIDNDCDLLVDANDTDAEPPGGPWYVDGDGDGHGTSARFYGCGSVGSSTSNDDCSDSAAAVHPGAGESCNGIDDDCDGLVDAADPDLAATSPYYLDADHDGYGDPSTLVGACSPPTVDHVTVAGDCNDGAFTVHNGAIEICGNGIDEDCDLQADGVRYFPTYSFLYPEQNMTALFQSGTPGTPTTIDLPHDGRVEVCPGTYYVRLRPITNDLKIVGLGTPAQTILDGAGATVLVVPTGVKAELVGVTVRGGSASQSVVRPDSVFTSQYTAGGGIFCTRTSTSYSDDVTLDQVILESNSAQLGGAIFVDRCRLRTTNVEIKSNSASFDGGGIYIARSAYTTLGAGTSIHGNTASGSGGGIFAYYDGGTWTSIDVSGNSAQTGGGFTGSQAYIQIVTSNFGVNTASQYNGGGVYLRDTSTSVSFSECTFGASMPDVRFANPVNLSYSYVGTTTVSCSTATASCQ